MAAPDDDARDVFVVHGRNLLAARALDAFLRAVDLRPISWDDAIGLTGEGSPFVGDILEAGFGAATAAVILLTPDETVSLRPQYASGHDPNEVEPSPQARPNVLFEAGMAMGKFPERTVLVQLGDHREVSDIAGRHLVRLDDSTAKRQSLIRRLETAGCTVNRNGPWDTAGDFDSFEPRPATSTGPDVDQELRVTVDEVRHSSRVIGRIENRDNRARRARLTITFLGRDGALITEETWTTGWVERGETVPFGIDCAVDCSSWHERQVRVDQLYDR